MPFTGGRPFSFAGAEPKQSLARLARSVPPACGGEGLGMGGRKAGRFIRSSKHQAALPPTQPSPPQAGGGLERGANREIPFQTVPMPDSYEPAAGSPGRRLRVRTWRSQ
ncbi:hypothetical protein BOSE127_120006 [Bosea sp. 127]|nr:hypothetical protein BOSE127_120006 [Bosea sp. 127]